MKKMMIIGMMLVVGMTGFGQSLKDMDEDRFLNDQFSNYKVIQTVQNQSRERVSMEVMTLKEFDENQFLNRQFSK